MSAPCYWWVGRIHRPGGPQQSGTAQRDARVPSFNVVSAGRVPARATAPPPVPEAASHPVVVRRGTETVVAAEPAEVVVVDGADAFDRVDRLPAGWWAGYLSYDLGRAVEAVRPRLAADTATPDVVLARFDARLVVGADGARLEGTRRARSALDRLLQRAPAPRTLTPPPGTASSSLDRDEFEARVRSIIELVEAGDCYQVNLTRRLTWDLPVDAVALHRAVASTNRAPHGALLVLPTPQGPMSIVSASPERFLRWRGADCETRPIKGTGIDAELLGASAKDRAENVMIVDLARNDLGRVCEPGSIHVPSLFGLEHHPGLVHLVSTVRGRRRTDVGIGALLHALFPPASVTGAPKPRVLQIIEDLEPVRRGVYCGAVGWLDTERDEGDLAVAIRTFTVVDGETRLGVGSGIVADSDPGAEWEETELKSARLLRALGSEATVAV
jgi:para-aminobenzoate synthetase component 1